MNKDKIGLIKYVSILVVEMFLPLIWLGMFFLGLGLSESNLINFFGKLSSEFRVRNIQCLFC